MILEIEELASYQIGMERGQLQGLERGLVRGLEQGQEQGQQKIVLKLLDKLPPDQVADLSGMSLAEVQAIADADVD